MPAVYCPHCALVLGRTSSLPYPRTPVRCRHCRLVVGAGRARTAPDAAVGARGAAAGRYASEARRSARAGRVHAGPRDRDRLAAAVRDVARELDRRTGQVTLIDYQERVEERTDLPALDEVIAAFGTWKAAITAAGRR